jgi:predicted O-methyltransferase YrrM
VDARTILEEIYATNLVRDDTGDSYRLSSEVDSKEGAYLYRLIKSDQNIAKTLEVGCAYGLSSLYICDALKDRPGASHVIIDPKQSDVWHGVGITHLKRAQIEFFTLIEEPSELALPAILRTEGESFDLVFIDGWHTFDQTMLDLYYANRLVREGGYIVVDDASWESVSAAVSYYVNYPAYELVKYPRAPRRSVLRRAGGLIPAGLAQSVLPADFYSRFYRRLRFPTMVAIRKVRPDTRKWTWFERF